MKQLKKGLLTLLVGVFGLLSVNAQTNLLENGDFKNGTTGWNLGTDFSLGGDSSYPYIQTGYIDQYGSPRVSTDGQSVEGMGGNTYIFSFWADGLSESNVKGSFNLEDKDGNPLYNVPGMEGVFYNSFYFKEVESANGWKKFQKEIKIPSNVYKMTKFGISLIGSDRNYKKISEISMVKKENPAPKNFKVVEDELSQRVVMFSWDAVNGKSYRIKVNGFESIIADGDNTSVLHGLKPNTKYTAEIYTKDAPDVKSTIEFTTKDFIEKNEENRVPFLGNIKDDKIEGKFVPQILDLTGVVIDQIEVTFNNSPAVIEEGYVVLPTETSGKLVVKIIQENREETVITYDSVTKK